MEGDGDGWVTVRIKRPLAQRIRNLVTRKKKLGYRSTAGFVEDAVRRRLEDYE